MYHKVDQIVPSIWWVTPADLDRQLSELSRKGFSFVHLDDYVDPDQQVVITFDGGYEGLFHHAMPVLAKHKAPYEIFLCSSLVGGWNSFHDNEPLTRCLGMDHLQTMKESGARIQWHGRSPRDFTRLSNEELIKELALPQQLREHFPLPHLAWLSYPYGLFDERVANLAKTFFAGAVTTLYNYPDGRWQKIRVAVDRFTSFRDLPRVPPKAE